MEIGQKSRIDLAVAPARSDVQARPTSRPRVKRRREPRVGHTPDGVLHRYPEPTPSQPLRSARDKTVEAPARRVGSCERFELTNKETTEDAE